MNILTIYVTLHETTKSKVDSKNLHESLWAKFNANKLTSRMPVYKSSPSSTLPFVIPE